MKFKIIYKLFALLLLAFMFQSRSAGPAGIQGLQVTGAPGNGTCANTGCHTAGQFDPSLTIELLDGDDLVDKYEPGKEYTIRVTVASGSGTPESYGFQATSFDESNDFIGEFSPGSGQQVVTIAGKDYLEHNQADDDGVFEAAWTAPAPASGMVTFYASGIATNGNNNSSGDGQADNSLSIEEDPGSSTSSINRDYATIKIFTNPVSDELKLQITSRTAGNFDLRIADLSGKLIQSEPVFLSSGENEKIFSVRDLESGFYAVQLCGEHHIAAVQMLKL